MVGCNGVDQFIFIQSVWLSLIHKFDHLKEVIKTHLIRLKKKKCFVPKLARIFQTDAPCGFLFFILFFFYFNWPLPPRTSETKIDWKVSTSVFSEIKQDFTRSLSSHVLKFFQNSKLSSFFVVKMKKKKNFKKKKMKVWILQNQMRTEKQMRAAALRHRIFFFSLSWLTNRYLPLSVQCVWFQVGSVTSSWILLECSIKTYA